MATHLTKSISRRLICNVTAWTGAPRHASLYSYRDLCERYWCQTRASEQQKRVREGRAPSKFHKGLHVEYAEARRKVGRNDGHRDPMACSRTFRSNGSEHPASANDRRSQIDEGQQQQSRQRFHSGDVSSDTGAGRVRAAVSTSRLLGAAVGSDASFARIAAPNNRDIHWIFRYPPLAPLRAQLDGHRGVRIDADAGRRAPALDRASRAVRRPVSRPQRARERRGDRERRGGGTTSPECLHALDLVFGQKTGA